MPITFLIKARSAAMKKKSKLKVLRKSATGLVKHLPMMGGVILIISLIKSFVPSESIASLFSGNPLADTIVGSLLGSVLAGNTMNSYIIGREMLESGISLFAATAFLVAWVTVGFVQIPAESKTLGRRFALVRNGLSMVLAVAVSLATVWISGGVN